MSPADPSPRVAWNLLWCVPGQVGGSEEYTVRLLMGLADHPDVGELGRIVVFGPQGLSRAHPELARALEVVEAPVDGRSRPRRILAEHTWLPERTRGAELVHHGGGTVPVRRSGRRSAMTLHDLQYLTYPRYFGRTKRAYLGATVPRSVQRCDVVVVPSDFVRGTVLDAFGVAPERVVVVPHGLAPGLGRNSTPEAVLRRRYGLGDGPVLVLPAVTHPHKGHGFLLRLLAEHWRDPELRLVLIGGVGAAEGEVLAAIDRLGLGERVIRAGRVPDADRDGLVRLAEALVFPSEYEGFGAPVVEAMALGTPVITSDRTCLPEVVGEAGLCRPLELDAWAPALEEVRQRRAELVAAGQRRARSFTARAAAERLLGAYRQVLA